MRIDIPSLLVHLRAKVVDTKGRNTAEGRAMAAMAWMFGDYRRLEKAQKAAKLGGKLLKGRTIHTIPGPFGPWTSARDVPELPTQSFRDWWDARSAGAQEDPR